MKMSKIKDMTVDELEHLIEQKVLELLGDPDAGLELRPDFKEELNRRLRSSRQNTSHLEVVKRFG
jgi:hypothetical protein